MRTSKRDSVCVKGALSQLCLRKANWEIGVGTGVQALPGIAGGISSLSWQAYALWGLALEVSGANELAGDAYQAVLEDEIAGFRVRVAPSRAE